MLRLLLLKARRDFPIVVSCAIRSIARLRVGRSLDKGEEEEGETGKEQRKENNQSQSY